MSPSTAPLPRSSGRLGGIWRGWQCRKLPLPLRSGLHESAHLGIDRGVGGNRYIRRQPPFYIVVSALSETRRTSLLPGFAIFPIEHRIREVQLLRPMLEGVGRRDQVVVFHQIANEVHGGQVVSRLDCADEMQHLTTDFIIEYQFG